MPGVHRPEWATAKVRFHLATCWYGEDGDGCALEGVRWWDDALIMFSTWFHNWFVAPFRDEGFPIIVLEEYPVGTK